MTTDVLDAKTQMLVALGAAVAARCQHCFAKLHGSAGAVGVTAREIRAAVGIASKVSAKSQEFMAAFVADTTGDAAATKEIGDGCGCA